MFLLCFSAAFGICRCGCDHEQRGCAGIYIQFAPILVCVYITEEFGSVEVYSGLNLIPSSLEVWVPSLGWHKWWSYSPSAVWYDYTRLSLTLSVCLSVSLSVSLFVSVSVSHSLCSLHIAGLQGFVVKPPSAECGGAVDRTWHHGSPGVEPSNQDTSEWGHHCSLAPR